jgi:hypothetical protein
MARDLGALKCPACGSTELDHGRMSNDVSWFRSAGWVSGAWQLEAFVCLNCGILTPHLSTADLETLRAKNS